jgi:threonine aldolase
LWQEIARHTTGLAQDLEERLRAFPEIRLAFPVHSNALFVHVPKPWLKPLREKFFFYIWDGDTQQCRWMIGWDWSRELSMRVIEAIQEIRKVR